MKRPVHFLIALSLLLLQGAVSNAQRITVTVAGTGASGFSGDHGPARKARLSSPNYMCTDAAHNVYFADQGNSRIRKLTATTGIITTIAGGGTAIIDGIPAVNASVSLVSLSCDPVGNIFFATSGGRVRKVDAVSNLITTIAGAGISVADGVAAYTATLGTIGGVCADVSGNLFVLTGDRVRKINSATGIITTVGGTGISGFSGDGGPATAAKLHAPLYIAIDPAGNLYFGDQGSGELIRRIDGTTGIITSVIGTGGSLFGCPGLSTHIGGLSGLCCDGDGNVIFNEWSCSCRKWDRAANWVTLVGGDFSIESFDNDTTSDFAWMNNNYGICADEANNYYIGDRGNNRIRKIIQLTHTPTFAFAQAAARR